MQRAVELGGHATFIVDRSLEGWTAGTVVKVERGRLHFYRDRLEYAAERTEFKCTILPEDLTEYGFNHNKGAAVSVFHIHTRKNKKEDHPGIRSTKFRAR